MCGPILVLRQGQGAGERVYCRNCAGEYLTEVRQGQLQVKPTGQSGSPQDLEPQVDTVLINQFVRESARSLIGSSSPLSNTAHNRSYRIQQGEKGCA